MVLKWARFDGVSYSLGRSFSCNFQQGVTEFLSILHGMGAWSLRVEHLGETNSRGGRDSSACRACLKIGAQQGDILPVGGIRSLPLWIDADHRGEKLQQRLNELRLHSSTYDLPTVFQVVQVAVWLTLSASELLF